MNFLLAATLFMSEPAESKQYALFSRLEPQSIAEHLAFYNLYDTTELGNAALQASLTLMGIQQKNISLSTKDVDPFLSLIQRKKITSHDFSDAALQLIEQAASKLSNRKLKGFLIKKTEDILSLQDQDIDLSEALLYTQIEDSKTRRKMRAMIDLMALQLVARLPAQATNDQKIDAINHLLFTDMGFRFPPHSTFQKNIDLFTLLPSVIEERKGVCLGVSLIYIALAQRIDLPLEIVTPPGHIYIRTVDRNIETTMHGVHLHSSSYMGLSTRHLPIRTRKEAIGLSYINQASLDLSSGNYEKAYNLYQTASLYIKNDPLLEELTGVTLFLLGNESEAKKYLLRSISTAGDEICDHSLPYDILNKRATRDAIIPLFQLISEDRTSIEAKKTALEKVTMQHPEFQTALFQLAICYLELNQPKEALRLLERKSALGSNDLSTEYLLANLYMERNNLPQARIHLLRARKIFHEALPKASLPPALQELEYFLFYSSGLQNNRNEL